MNPSETPLTGGQMASPVRVGQEVHRAAGPWTPAVHELLKHLKDNGFEKAPTPIGLDDVGREVLEYIDGDAGFFSAERTHPVNLWSDEILVEAAKTLREYHDATINFADKSEFNWQLSNKENNQYEVICHNDFAPYNCIFNDSHITTLIDFDTAGPGIRIDDIAYAAYSFIPLFREEKWIKYGLLNPFDRAKKLTVFCETYGQEFTPNILEAIILRIQRTKDMVIDKAAQGDIRFQQKINEGHLADYDADIAYIRQNKDEWNKQLK